MLFPKSYADIVQRLRVPAQIVLAAAFVWLAAPDRWSLLAGLPLSIAGLGLRAWAAGHLRKNERLTMSGPYAYVRNPLYDGSLLAAVGCTVASGRVELALLTVAVFLFVYLPVMQQEEQHLAKLFPEFAAYARRVPQLVPRLGAGLRGAGFDWAVYRKNKEQKALYGLAAVYGFLVLKSLWR